LPFLARLLDDASREWWFAPAYYEALEHHLETQAERAWPGRAAGRILFSFQILFLVCECLRL